MLYRDASGVPQSLALKYASIQLDNTETSLTVRCGTRGQCPALRNMCSFFNEELQKRQKLKFESPSKEARDTFAKAVQARIDHLPNSLTGTATRYAVHGRSTGA